MREYENVMMSLAHVLQQVSEHVELLGLIHNHILLQSAKMFGNGARMHC